MAQKGFTLVELAVVLVIMGLLVGGILAGRELVEQAALRDTVKKLKDYNIALVLFEGKYNCLPGDCAKASVYGLNQNAAFGQTAEGDGDGNGVMDSFSGYFDIEMANFWVHFSNSGLLKEVFQQIPGCDSTTPCNTNAGEAFPATKIGNGMVALSDRTTAKTYFVTGTGKTLGFIEGSNGEDSVSANTLTPLQAYYIDEKLDDGIPNSGKVRVYSYFYAFPELIDDSSNVDTEACYSSNVYNLNVSNNVCSLKMESSHSQ